MKTISISFGDVKTRVLRLSEYVGLKAGAYDKLRAIDSDAEQLKLWYHDGLALAGVLLDRVIGRATTIDETNGNATFTLVTVNDNLALVKSALEEFVSSHIIVRWLELVAPQLLEMYTGNFKQAEQTLLRLCYYREMPR